MGGFLSFIFPGAPASFFRLVLKILTVFFQLLPGVGYKHRAGRSFLGRVKGRRDLRARSAELRAASGRESPRLHPQGWGVRDLLSSSQLGERAAHGPGTPRLDKICQACASRAHQGCGSLPELSSFVIATVNQHLKTKSKPGRASPGDYPSWKGGGAGEG